LTFFYFFINFSIHRTPIKNHFVLNLELTKKYLKNLDNPKKLRNSFLKIFGVFDRGSGRRKGKRGGEEGGRERQEGVTSVRVPVLSENK
jgi:hypothetical protein